MRMLVETMAALLARGQGEKPEALLGPEVLLGPEERAVYDSLTAPKRRAEWLAGRVAAKRLILSYLAEYQGRVLEPQQVEVVPRADGSPAVYLDYLDGRGRREAEVDLGVLRLSISHRSVLAGEPENAEEIHGLVAVAVVEPPLAVGIDVELVESRDPVFEQDYFTEDERSWTRGDPFRITVGWSAKEAAFKATRTGLSEDPRAVEVRAGEGKGPVWFPLQVNYRRAGGPVCAWFTRAGDFVTTLVLLGENCLDQDLHPDPWRAGI